MTTTPVFVAEVDAPYLYDVDAIDADGNSISYALVLAPSGMSIDPITGRITWEPTAADVTGNPIVVVVSATDELSAVGTQGFQSTCVKTRHRLSTHHQKPSLPSEPLIVTRSSPPT
ncbi:MAG: putative Ig domain-containing protein [Pirellulaceae bacterium]